VGDLLKPNTQASATAQAGEVAEKVVADRQGDGFAVSAQTKVEIAQKTCAAAAYALSGTAIGEPAIDVVRQASGEDAVVTIVLAEYEGGRAPSAMDALATVVDACADGFTATVDGEARSFGKLVPELAPEGVDQAMGLGAVAERGGVKVPVKVVVLRQGNTVAYLSAVPQAAPPRTLPCRRLSWMPSWPSCPERPGASQFGCVVGQ
jgi:hypothetical protein